MHSGNRVISFVAVVYFFNIFLTRSSANFISVGAAHFDILEITVYIVVLALAASKVRVLRKSRVDIISTCAKALAEHRILVVSGLLFSAIVFFSIIAGVVAGNKDAMVTMRGYLFFYASIALFMLAISGKSDEADIGPMNAASIVLAILVLVSFVSKDYTNLYKSIIGLSEPTIRFDVSFSGSFGNYYLGASAALFFAFTYNAYQFMCKKSGWQSALFTLIALLSMLVYFHKPVVVLAVFACSFIFVGAIRRYGAKRMVLLGFSLVFAGGLFYVLLPEATKTALVSSFSYKWLNIGRYGAEGDLSTGRFDLWKEYFGASLRGFGFAPWGVGHVLPGALNRNPHNHLVFLSYNSGILSALLFGVHMAAIIYVGYKNGHRLNNALCLSSTAFILGVLFLSMYSGVMNATREYILLFGLCYAMIVKSDCVMDLNVLPSTCKL